MGDLGARPDDRCGAPSARRVYWPGSPPLEFCEAHAAGAENVAQAMGFFLALEPGTPGATCESKGRAP